MQNVDKLVLQTKNKTQKLKVRFKDNVFNLPFFNLQLATNSFISSLFFCKLQQNKLTLAQ